jgi:hypothetical protein
LMQSRTASAYTGKRIELPMVFSERET